MGPAKKKPMFNARWSTHTTSNLLVANDDINTTASAHVLIEVIRMANVILKENYLDKK